MRVAPLPLETERGGPGAAVDLFVDRLADADTVRFSELTAGDRICAATICERLDGVPLALELAAGRARDLPLSAIVAGLDERFAFFTDGRRTALPRQHTLRGMIDWSFALLDQPERDVFPRLGIFAHAFTDEAAADVCADGAAADVRTQLAALVAKSLVTIVRDRSGRQRYRLLETIRAYARDRLRECGDEARVAHRFAAYYARLASDADARFGRSSRSAFVASGQADLENFRAALAWSLGGGNDIALGARLAGDMGLIYREAALLGEGARWAQQALAHASTLDPQIVGRLQIALSYYHFSMGTIALGLEAAEAATAAYDEAGAVGERAWAMAQECYCLYRLGRVERIGVIGFEAVRLARASGDPYRLANALNAYALALGADRSAERFATLEEAIACYREAGDDDAIVATAHLAAAYHEAGRNVEARALAVEAVGMARRNRDDTTVAGTLVNAAGYALALDDAAAAERDARDGLELVRGLGKTLFAMCLLQHAGSAASRFGDSERAARLTGAADALYGEFGLVRESTERTLYERTRAEIAATLGETRAKALLAEGAALPIEGAIAEAIAG